MISSQSPHADVDDLQEPTLIPSFLTLAWSSVRYGAIADSALLLASVVISIVDGRRTTDLVKMR
jgi:hypothetical protein